MPAIPARPQPRSLMSRKSFLKSFLKPIAAATPMRSLLPVLAQRGNQRSWTMLTALWLGLILATQPVLAQKDSPGSDAKLVQPVKRQMVGWTVHVDPQLLQGEHAREGARALKMLENHLFFISLLAPKRRLEELRTLEIWIELHHPSLSTMAYHPSAGWLAQHGHDVRLAKKVHIPNASQLLDRRQLMKHPMVVLHELAHAYHDQRLGFEEPRIKAAFDAAKKSGRYESVLDHRGQKVKHYALSNHKEYFAEATEAYFNRNDFFPFVRAELAEFDPGMHALLREIWGDLPR